MLILKMSSDLPISVRNVGHSIGESLKRLEMTFFTELKLGEESIREFESHIYEMTSIGRNVLALGDDANFEIDKLYSRLEYFQQDYSTHAVGILSDLSRATDSIEPIAAMLVNEINRTFTDEIQMSTVNRLNELQELLETTAMSHISGLLRLDWSATSFIAKYKELYNLQFERYESDIRELVAEKLKTKEDFDIDEVMKQSLKECESKSLEFTKSEIAENVAEEMRSKYTELFIHNEDLTILQNQAIVVAMNCLTRGNAKKMILSSLHLHYEKFEEQLRVFVESMRSSDTVDFSSDTIYDLI